MKYEAVGMKATSGIVRLPIDQNRYEEIKRAKRTCLFALDIEEKFALMLDNFADFEVELLRLAQHSLIWPKREHHDAMKERLTLDRRLVNLLASCRMYLDQTAHAISSEYGSASPELSGLKKLKQELYDAHPGYRIMEALRNHAQHAALPVRAIYYQWRLSEGKGDDYVEYTVFPQTETGDLKESGSFKKVVLDDLEKLGKSPDLRGPVREYIACMVQLQEFLRNMIAEKVQTSRTIYNGAVSEFSTMNGESILFPSVQELDESGDGRGEITLPAEFLEYYDLLLHVNVVNKKLRFSFASNSDQEQ